MNPLELSEADLRLLEAFTRYRLLTIPQCLTLGIANRKHLGERLRRLVEQNYVAYVDAWQTEPRIYWMREKAGKHFAEILGPDCERNTIGVKGRVEGQHLRQHSKIVDVHIAARQWAERSSFKLQWFKGVQEGGQLVTLKLDGQIYEPDAICAFEGPDGRPHLCVLEVETGGQRQDYWHFSSMLPARLEAKRLRLVERVLDWQGPMSARLMFVFSSAEMLAAALRPIAADAMPAVFFASLPGLMADFGGCWVTAASEAANPFR